MTEAIFYETELAVGDLEVDERVQRNLVESKVRRIIHNYNPAAIGIITVSKRVEAGDLIRYVILDGQHRYEAVRRLTDNQGTIKCRVFNDLTVQDDARLFLDLNDSTKPRYIDKFKVSVYAGDEQALRIKDLAGRHGWAVQAGTGTGIISAAEAMKRIDRLSIEKDREPHLLEMAILAVTRAWGHDRYGVQAPTLEGLAHLFDQYQDLIDFDHLVATLKSWKRGAEGLKDDADNRKKINKMSAPMAVAATVVQEYNLSKRGRRKLDEWRRSR